MKNKTQGCDEAYNRIKDNAYFRNGFLGGIDFAERFIHVSEEMPSIKNGYVDEDVLVFVKNKNKEDGIILWDLCSFGGESWTKRTNTWETIIGWRPVFIKE